MIKKIIILDDWGEIFTHENFIESLSKVLAEALSNKNNSDEIDENAAITLFFQKKSRENYRWEQWILRKKDAIESKEEEWISVLDKKLDEELALDGETLLLSDFCWEYLEETSETLGRELVYDYVKNKSNIIFILYSKILPERAQDFLDEKQAEKHCCRIMKNSLTIPGNDVGNILQRLKDYVKFKWE